MEEMDPDPKEQEKGGRLIITKCITRQEDNNNKK